MSELELLLPLELWLLDVLGDFGLLAPLLELEPGEDCDE